MTKLSGINKVYIISLLGSCREEHMRREMAKVGLDEFDDWEFIRPINGLLDLSIDELINKKIIDLDIIQNYQGKDMLYSNGKWKLGTVSLSMMNYYLYLKSNTENKTFLIIEDNVTLCEDFVYKYNLFYGNLPSDDWKSLSLHSFNNRIVDENVYEYYSKLKNKYSYLNDIEIPLLNFQQLTNDVRPMCNDYVLLGAIEGSGCKCFVIRPSAIYDIPRLPLIYPSDGMKNWLSGWWTDNISFVSREQLVQCSGKFSSDRRFIDGDMVTQNNYIPLDEEYIFDMITYITENHKRLFGDH